MAGMDFWRGAEGLEVEIKVEGQLMLKRSGVMLRERERERERRDRGDVEENRGRKFDKRGSAEGRCASAWCSCVHVCA